MKTIIAGSRHITSQVEVLKAILQVPFQITEVVCGAARGVDMLGAQWANQCRKPSVPVKYFHAAWDTHGKAAGPMRNVQMAEYADALIAVWDGKSRGTKHMIDTAKQHGLQVYIHMVS